MKSFISDVLRVGISNIIMIVFGIATSIIVARVLGPEKNGIIAALLVYPSLFMSIGSLGIRQSTTYLIGKKIFQEEHVKTAITQIWVFSSVMSIVISFCLMYYFSKSGDNMLLVILALIPIPFALFNTYNSGIFLGKNQIGVFNKINWIPSVLVFLLTVLLLIVLPYDMAGYMMAMLSGSIFIFIVLLFRYKFIQSFRLTFNWTIIKSLLSLGIVYAISLLAIGLNYKIDIVLLDKMSVPFEIGIYSKGAGIAQYLWHIPMLLSTIIFARSAVSKNDKAFSYKVAQLLRVSMVIIGLGSLCLFVLSEVVIIGLYGEDFRGSIGILNILLPGVLLLTFFKVMNMDLAGKGKPWIALKAMLPALAVNIVLNIILIPNYGGDGAAFASTVSYSIASLLFLHFYSKEVDIPLRIILHYKKSDFAPIFQLIKKIRK